MRKRKPKARAIQGDPRYNDVMVSRFINNLQWSGKKAGEMCIRDRLKQMSETAFTWFFIFRSYVVPHIHCHNRGLKIFMYNQS